MTTTTTTATATASSTSGQPRLDSDVDPNYRIDVSNLDTRVLWRITAIAFGHRWRMALGIGATILAAIFQLFVPQYVGQAVDQVQDLLAIAADGDARAAQEAARDALLQTALLLMGASVMRCLFTMFAEDVGLLTREGFTDLLGEYKGHADKLHVPLSRLFADMNKGGFSPELRSDILRFNGA